jgi:hypothetical protein
LIFGKTKGDLSFDGQKVRNLSYKIIKVRQLTFTVIGGKKPEFE